MCTLSKLRRKARKEYWCDFCNQKILKGTEYTTFRGVDHYRGKASFMVDRRHQYCLPEVITAKK